MSEIAILGCGPAGLLAALAVEQARHSPIILSRKAKSSIPGSQYLHAPIPGLTSVYPENTVQYVRMGTAAGYAEKVYGDASRYTGWDNYRALYPSWNVIKAYDALWDRYEDCVREFNVESEDLIGILNSWETVISTLPQSSICRNPNHRFAGVPYWIKTLPLPEVDKGHDIVIYNGMPEDHWYRYSILGDRCSIETTAVPLHDPDCPMTNSDAASRTSCVCDSTQWADPVGHTNRTVPEGGWLQGTKAVSNDCDCWPGVHRAGRWAEWRHGVLLHDAYNKVKEVVNAIGS